MERKIGETFWFKGKRYKVIASRFNLCTSCVFSGACVDSAKVAGICTHRSDKKNVFFKEIKDMEIKDNKLTINIPKGMEIDVENSNLKEGIIKFRNKDINYIDVCISLDTSDESIIVSNTNCEKVKAISRLMDIADYYNKGWKPNWDNKDKVKFYIAFDTESSSYTVKCGYMMSYNIIYFKNRKDAQEVIDNPNFRDILDTIYKC